jgi:hypothetical protein
MTTGADALNDFYPFDRSDCGTAEPQSVGIDIAPAAQTLTRQMKVERVRPGEPVTR